MDLVQTSVSPYEDQLKIASIPTRAAERGKEA
jgi:hypothetical protein